MANEKQVSMASEQTHAVAEEIVTLTSSSVSAPCAKLTRSGDVWCVDSGATTHMCRDRNSFLELTPTVTNKRQKTVKEIGRNADTNEFFPGLGRVEFRPDSGPEDTLCFHYYNATERIHGKTMEEWIRPSISFWHAFCYTGSDYYGQPTFQRSWDDGTHTIDNYKRRIRAAFEFYNKLGNKFWTLSDMDIAPEGDTIDETHHNLDEITELILELQQKSSVRPLWVSANLHSQPRYVQGAATSSDAQVVGYAGSQLKKSLELALKLGAECFMFRGWREGYNTLLNTDLPRELRNYSRLLKMTADYKDRLGYRGQLLFDSTYHINWSVYKEQSANQQRLQYHYNPDPMSSLYLLKHYNLERQYKLATTPGHQLVLTSAYGMLGSIEAIHSYSRPTVHDTTLLMKTVIEQGGMQPGGLNIGVPLRRGSTEVKDLLVAYISCIDVYARGLRNAAKVIADGIFTKNLQQQYLSFHSGFGSRLNNGEVTLEDCEDQAHKHPRDTNVSSQRTEHWEAVFNHYI
uniref:Xylose isomerase n=1 Tax=Timema bartmani TaxID=61472 RepID=A0A7R9ENH4_9NEOP|nr:unnamed protein product [Timema bartmani]